MWLALATVLLAAAAAFLWTRRGRSAERFGRYRLVTKIGEGGMGVVYAGEDRRRRLIAIKVLPAERRSEVARRRFAREIELARALDHPNTVSVLDAGLSSAGTPYVVMEYLDGIDLEGLLRLEGPLEPSRAIDLLTQICLGVGALHRRGYVHRDIKPANVIVCRDGTAKLIDFGLARPIAAAPDVKVTGGDVVTGSPHYLSPEAIASPGAVDARSDVYALGALAYATLTGTPVFGGRTIAEICSAHLYAVPVPPSVRRGRPLPAVLERIVLRCLAKDPDERPRDATSLAAELRSAAAAAELAEASLDARPIELTATA